MKIVVKLLRELGMSVSEFWGPQIYQVACPALTVWTRPIE